MPLNAFTYLVRVIRITSVKSSLRSNLACTLKGMAPTPHAILPRNWRVWLEVNLTSVSLRTSGVYYKSPWSLPHSKVACLLALVIAFSSLWWNQARGLLKTHAFIVAWSWTFKPYYRVDGHLGLHDSMVTLWCAFKCCTKLYLTLHNASHPSTF